MVWCRTLNAHNACKHHQWRSESPAVSLHRYCLANYVLLVDVHTPTLFKNSKVTSKIALLPRAAPSSMTQSGLNGAGWMGTALQACADSAEAVLLDLASATNVEHEWIGVVCHQAAFSCWLLERMNRAERWIMRGVEATQTVVGEETFRLLLLCVQFFEGHDDKVELERALLDKLLRLSRALGKSEYVEAVTHEIAAHSIATSVSARPPAF